MNRTFAIANYTTGMFSFVDDVLLYCFQYCILYLLNCRNKSKPVGRSQQASGVFGRSLLNNLQEIGSPLPSWVILAMQRIRRCAAEAIGIFRKSGVRSRIQKFRDQIQSEPGEILVACLC